MSPPPPDTEKRNTTFPLPRIGTKTRQHLYVANFDAAPWPNPVFTAWCTEPWHKLIPQRWVHVPGVAYG